MALSLVAALAQVPLLLVGQPDLDLAGVVHHVGVGDDVAVGRDDRARAAADPGDADGFRGRQDHPSAGPRRPSGTGRPGQAALI